MQADDIIRKIEVQEWLSPAEDALKRGLDAVFEPDRQKGKPIENALHGVWLGHALHPVLTDVPIGAWTVALVLDVVEGSSGTRKYRAGADGAIIIGLVGAAGAALTGLTDWKEISVESRRTGLIHGLLNSVATGFYLASSIQRARGKRSGARWLAYVGYGITMGAAWLGGHLVYANQIGVERTAGKRPPVDFVPVMAVAELPDEKPRRAEYQGYPIVLVKKANTIYALADLCSHLGGPLSEGQVEGDCIRCPWHGSLFSLENGAVIESPATRPQIAFEARVRGGQIEIRANQTCGSDLGTPAPK